MQAKCGVHSLLLMHSGLQFGGTPMNSVKHEQAGDSPLTMHCELGPHGDGIHGFCGTIGGLSTVAENIRN